MIGFFEEVEGNILSNEDYVRVNILGLNIQFVLSKMNLTV
jgi:hypothetical protein